MEGTISRDETIIVQYMKDYEPTYTLIIQYVIDDESIEPPEAYIDESLKEGDEYSVPTPLIDGYYADIDMVSGIMDETLKNIKVTYYSEVKSYTLTINYIYEGGNVAAPKHEKRYKVGETYNISSPAIDGFYASTDRVFGTMGAVGNIVVTVTYRENPSGEEEISGLVDLDTVKIPEGTTLEGALALLPKKIPVFIQAGHETIEIGVTWKVDPVTAYPTKDNVVGIYNYTGGYRFYGELELPFNVSNPWEFEPPIDVEIYPIDYPDYYREIQGNTEEYTVSYEDIYGDKQGSQKTYKNGYLYEVANYKDGRLHGECIVYDENGDVISKDYYINGEKVEDNEGI